MTLIGLTRTAMVSALLAGGGISGAIAQGAGAGPSRPELRLAQATTAPEAGAAQPGQPAQPGMMRPGMMGQGMGPGMMGPGMMGPGMMGPGMMGHAMMGGMPMMGGHGHLMKVMFAIADTDGDGALSFEEVTAIHRRIFNRVDANKDGKVTIEEVQAFMRD